MITKKSTKTIFLSITIFFIFCLSLTFIPFIQQLAINIVENLKHDDINDVFWKQQMFAFGCLGIVFFILLSLICCTNKGYNLFIDHISKIKEIYKNIKNNKKYLYILIAFYFIGYFSIIRANFWNFSIDDLPRQMEGSREWVNFYRYISEFGSIILHTSTTIFDIAPLTQFFAIFFISIASFFIISIFTENNFSILNCFAILPVGLFPFYLSNFSYRYDSPYMAFSVLVCVIPFLFHKNLKHFYISSILCLFLMCISYQASSGIYIFLAVLVFTQNLISKKMNSKELLHFTLASIFSFIISLLLFSFIFIEKVEGDIYVDTAIKLSNILTNLELYLKTLITDLGFNILSFLSITVFFIYIIYNVINSKINKILTFFVALLTIVFCIPMTFGAYLAIAKPEFIPRAFIGIGVFIGTITLICSNLQLNSKFLNAIKNFCLIYLSYCTIAFAYGFGNAQYDQKEYIQFRSTILSYDLSEVIPETDEAIELLFVNNLDYTKSVDVLGKVYPLVYKSIDRGFSSHRGSEFVLESFNLCKLISGTNHNYLNSNFPILKENRYHIIQGYKNKYLITFKIPDQKVIKTRSFIDYEE